MASVPRPSRSTDAMPSTSHPYGLVVQFDHAEQGVYAQLRLMEEIMWRLEYDNGLPEGTIRPADYFNLMSGTGWGALAAMCLGRLQMTIKETKMAILNTAQAVDLGLNRTTRSTILRAQIKKILRQQRRHANLRLRNPTSTSQCHVVIFAAPTNQPTRAYAFRSYRSRRFNMNRKVSIVDAVCASLSTPHHFNPSPVTHRALGQPLTLQHYAGHPTGSVTPLRETITEIRQSHYLGRNPRPALLLSLGGGPSSYASRNARNYGMPSAAGRERVVQEFERDPPNVEEYVRFECLNIYEPREGWSPENMGQIEAYFGAYLQDATVDRDIDRTVEVLKLSEMLPAASVTSLATVVSVTTTGSVNPSNRGHRLPFLWLVLAYHTFLRLLGIRSTCPPQDTYRSLSSSTSAS